MSFTINSCSFTSGAGNNSITLLDDGTYVGAPAPITYISADTVATIEAADYFNDIAGVLNVWDRIYAVGSDGTVDLTVSSVTFNPTAVITTTVAGLGDVDGPASSTDNAISRFSGITGKIIQNSGVILSDADALTGITSLTTDNLNLNGNSLISLDVNGDILLSPNGSGTVVINTDLDVDNLNLNANSLITTNVNGDLNLTPNGSGDVVIIGVTVDNLNAISGVTELDVDNLNFDSNTISTTDTNGDLALVPDGTGDVDIIGVTIDDLNAISGLTDFDCDNININANTISSTDTNGAVVIDPDGSGEITLGAATVTIEQYLMHAGDVNNFFEFGTDTQDFQTGGSSRLDISDSGVRMGAANSRVTTILDEDAMGSDSATSLCTQQSIKAYVDNSGTAQEYKKSALAASAAAYTVTYDNGASGVGATLTNAGAQAAFPMDGLTPAATSRVLVKDQAAPAQNGMYIVTDVGSGATNWVLTRTTDYDQIAEMDPGTLVTVDAGGTVNALTSWMQTTTVATIGTDAISYSQFTYSTTFPTLTVDNLNLNGNSIISLDANGNINLTPNGTGDVVIVGVTIDDVNAISGLTELDCDNININGNSIISSDTDGNINLTPNGTGLNVLANCQVTNVTASRAVVTDASSNLNESATTATEIGYINGLTGAIQTQLDDLIEGPATATDHAVVRFDLTTGKLAQDSSVLISDGNAVTGVTSLDSGNLRISANSLISTDTNGNVNITPDGTGDVNIVGVTIDDVNAISGLTDFDCDNININGNIISSTDTDGNISLTPDGAGLNVLANCQVTNVTASRAVVTDASSNLNESATTATELGYVNGVTSAIQTQIDNLSAAGSQRSITQNGHGFTGGEALYLNAAVYTLAKADAVGTADVVGFVIDVADVNTFTLQFGGLISAELAGLTAGAVQYLSTAVAGALQEAKPAAVGTVVKPLMIADSATSAYWNNMLGVLL